VASSVDRPLLGIALNIVGLAVFAVQDVVIKLLSDEYSAFQIVFTRSLVALVPTTMVLYITLGSRGLITWQLPVLLLRGVLLFISYTSYYLAVAALPLVDVVSIVFAAPLFVTALSGPVLGEYVGLRRWVAVLVGFSGVLIMVGPSGRILHPASLLALTAGLTYGLSIIMTRRVGATESSWTMSFYTVVVFAVLSALGSSLIHALDLPVGTNPSYAFLTRPWILPDMDDMALMILVGFVASVGFYCLTQAYRVAPVSIVAPFDYSYFIWALLFGYIFWSDLPTLATWLGVSIVIASGIYILRRELALQKQERERAL